MRNLRLFFFALLLPAALPAQDYKMIHEKAIVVDTHNDFISHAIDMKLAFDENLLGRAHSDLKRMKQGGVDVQVFSIFCDERFGKDTAFRFANIEIDSLYAIVKRNRSSMSIVGNPAELYKAVGEEKLAAMMGVEGGHMIEDDLNKLDSFYKRGVRYMTLTWNNSTSWASSAKDETNHTVPNAASGLNDFGKQVVRRMNELGMLVDLSHVGEKTFWDAIQTTSKPVLVSHSCAYTLCPVFRNLKDDQIMAVGKNGGVIQVNFYSGFVDSNFLKKQNAFMKLHQGEMDSLVALKKPDYEIRGFFSTRYKKEAEQMRPPLSMLIDHIDYMVKLIGADHVGLGSDFDGIDSAPLGLDGVEDFPKITQALVARGYSEKDIDKILGGNFIRVLKANTNK